MVLSSLNSEVKGCEQNSALFSIKQEAADWEESNHWEDSEKSLAQTLVHFDLRRRETSRAVNIGASLMCSIFIRGENLKVVFEVIVLQSAVPPAEWERRGALHFKAGGRRKRNSNSPKKDWHDIFQWICRLYADDPLAIVSACCIAFVLSGISSIFFFYAGLWRSASRTNT